jgi:hypothetical protein
VKKILLIVLSSFIFVLHADWTDKITINGFFNFEFEDRIAGDKNSKAEEFESFDSDMLNLLFNVQATDNLRVAIDLTWEHGAQLESEVDKGNVGYEYAFAEYTFNDAIKIRAGKMFTSFGIYNEIHDAKPSIIITKEPNPTNKIYFISNNGYEQTTLYPRWGVGIAILGDTTVGDIPLDYVVQLTNGDRQYGVGGNEYDKDDNNNKAVTARVRADLTDNLQVGVSVHHDMMNTYNKVYKTKTVTDTQGNTQSYVTKEYEPTSTMDIDSQGVQLIWHATDNFRFEAEYITGTLDVEGGTSFRRSGFSILPSYFVSDNINLYCLYAQADPNHNTDKDSVTNIAPGLNIEVANNAFVKLDVLHVISEKQNTLYNGDSYSEFRAALAIGF